MTTTTPDLYGDDEHPAAYDEPPTAIIPDDAEWTSRAAWHLRSIARINTAADEIVFAYDREIAKLETRRAEVIETAQRKAEWHRRPLVQLHEAILTIDPKRKTITLPGGKLTSRTQTTPTLSIEDRPAFIEWAQTGAPDIVISVPTIDHQTAKAALKQGRFIATGDGPVVTEHGEIIPGVTARPGRTTFNVVLDGEGDW